MTTQAAADAIGARHIGDAVDFTGVSSDSRNIAPGQLFIALKGPNFNAHDFIAQVIDAGAAAVMVDHEVSVEVEGGITQIVVPDTLKALGQLAAYWRMQFDFPVVGVTGSNGKTTVKEMLLSIFSTQWNTLATRGNLNNDIGLPLTLLSLGSQHQAAVIEMGANHPGEIAYLTKLARPTVALITNAGAAHLEGFGSIEGVAHAKGEIYQGLFDSESVGSAVAVVNADDDYAELWRGFAGDHRIISFGIENTADISCSWEGDVNGSRLNIVTGQGSFDCKLMLAGRHNVMNALAATAASIAAGVSLENIRQGLESMQPVKGRMQARAGVNGARVIDDTYNANPYSLQAALDVMAECEGEKFLALGDMGELGDGAKEMHQQAGRQARSSGVDALYAVGDFSLHAVDVFGDHGYHFDGHDAMIGRLLEDLRTDTTLLVKGSRSMQMERVVDAVTVD